MPYGTKYFAHYKSGNTVRTVQLQADGYSGAQTEWYCSTLAPQEEQGDSDSLFGEAIVSKVVSLEFLFQEDHDLTQFVAEPRTYKVVILEGSKVKFEGWAEPYNTSRAYEKPAYFVRMTATCGLNRLSKNEFPQIEFNEGNLTLNYFEIAQRCLATIGIDRPLRVSIHTYQNSSPSAPNPLLSCDLGVFRYFTEGRWLDCQSVLNDILQKFNAQLFLDDNTWVIRCFVDHALGVSEYIEYPVGGGQTIIPAWDGLIRDVNYLSGDAIGFAPTLDGGQVSLRPRVRKYTVNVDLGGKKESFANGGLQLWTVDGPVGWEGNMPKALGGVGWTQVETGMEGNPYALHIRGKAPKPYEKTHKKGLWPFRKTVKTAIEPAVWWESPKVEINYGVDESINIGFEYFTEANSAGFLYAIVMQGEELATGKISTTYLKPETNSAKLVNDFQLLTAPPHPKVNPTTGITQAKGKVEYNVDLTEVKSSRPHKYWFRIWFYYSVDEPGKTGDEYTIYRTIGEKSTAIENEVPEGDSRYKTVVESNPYESDEGDTVDLITGDYSEGYLGTTMAIGAMDPIPTGKWTRRGRSEAISIYRAMLLDRLSMTYEVPDVVEAKIKLLNDEDLKYSTLLRFVDRDPDRLYKIVRYSFDHFSRTASIMAVEATYTELSVVKQRSYTDARGLLDETPDGDAVYPGGGTPSSRIGEEDVFIDEDAIDEDDIANARTGIFENVPALIYTVNEQATRYVNLEDYLSEFYLEEEFADEIEEEDRHDPLNFVLEVVNKPSWLLSVTFDGLIVVATAKPTVVGEFELELSVVDDTFGIVPNVIVPIKVYPKTTIKYTLRDTSGLEPVGVGEITNGSGHQKPDKWDILVQVKGHHEGWYAKVIGMGIDVSPTPDPYALTASTDEATYIIGSEIESEVGIYNLTFATYRDEGEPDNLKLVKRDKIRFTLYDETYLNKATFELWGAESGTLIGPINPDGSSAFNVEEAWDVKMIVDGVEHDAGTSVLGSEVGDLDTLTIGPLDPAVEDASYFQLGEPRPEFDPSTYNVLLTLTLEGEEQYVRAVSFTINKDKVKPVGGKLQLVSMVPNTTNYDVMGVLALNGNLFTLPANGWSVLLESDVPAGTTRTHQLFQKKGDSLVAINTAIHTGKSQTKTYSVLTEEDLYFIFDELSSKDIGKIHISPSSFRVIITDEVDGVVANIYSADFSFGVLEDLDDLDISEPGNSGEGVQEYYAGRALSEIVDDYIKTFNVNVDDTTIEVFDQTNPSINWLRVKDKGITFAKIQDIPTLTLIGKLTAGTGTPYAIPVLNGASATAASDTTLGTTLWVKNQLNSTVTGVVNRFALFNTTTSLTSSILELSGINVTAREGQFVSDHASNTNIRGFAVQEGGQNRFSFGKQGTAANFAFWRFNDAGSSVLGTPLLIERSTGKITLETQLTILGSVLPPLVVSSTALVTNFNADLLDDHHGPYYLDRTNHTGTQLANTISNFSTAVLGTTLTGLAATNSTILATDTILQAFGKLQGQLTGNLSGTTGKLAKFTAANAIGDSLLEESGINLIGQQAQFVVNINHNTNVRGFGLQTGGTNRWSFGKQGLESTSDAGADFAFWRFSDTGSFLGTPLLINRATGKVTLETQLTILGSVLAPLVVGSTALVTNFNADLLDGQHGPYYLDRTNHTGTQLASTISNFATTVLGTVLTGLSTTNSAISATDTILQAFGKIQGQITGKISGTVGRLAYFNTTGSVADSIASQSGINLTVDGQFISNVAANANMRGFGFQAGGANRILAGKIDLESGSNSGSNFAIQMFDDAGTTLLSTPLKIIRATGAMTLSTQLTIQGSSAPLVVSSSSLVTNFNADLLDGQHGTYYLDWNNFTNVKSVLAGNGMTGGGALTSNVTLTLGTPSTLDASTTNSVSGTTHTHAITTGNLVAGSNVTLSGTLTNRLIGSGNVTISATSMPWLNITSKPITIDGFGITDGVKIGDFTTALNGKENTFSKGSLVQGTGISLSGTLTDRLVGTGNVTVSLATSGVTAGTYTSVTVDAYGRVTAGSNPGTGISGTAGYIAQFGSGGTTVVNSVIRDTGTEINVADTRSFGVEGPAAMRDYLHVWGYASFGTASNHGTLVLHNSASAVADSSAALEIRSTTKGMLFPRMTSTQRLAISAPAGLVVYQTDNAEQGAGLYLSYGSGVWLRQMPDLS